MNHLPVLIVGAGPTGMTAALELARHGISVRIVERMLQPAATSRAIGVQARTLELFQQRRIAEPLLEKGNRGVAGSIYGGGNRIFRLDFSKNGSSYGYVLFISQAETEAVLRGALEEQHVEIERGIEFAGLAQPDHEGCVHAFLRHKDGRLEEVVCDYLIDTEGAHSIGRMTLNMQFAGKTLEEQYVLGDLYVDGDLPSTDSHIFSSQHGFMGLFPMGGEHFRLIASNPLSLPRKDTAPSLTELQQIYDQRSHIPARFHNMTWSSWFRINSRMIHPLQSGRVFFGGDAAHIHSPAGAQGMNTGIQDMINLAWKLAFVIQGMADPRLLATYSDDRVPVIRNVLERTEGLTSAIGSENEVFRSVFNHIAPWIASTDFVQKTAAERMSQLSLNYRESPLSVTERATGAIHAGDRIPDLEVVVEGGNGSTLLTTQRSGLLGLLSIDQFTLLLLNSTDAAALHAAVQGRLMPWKEFITGWKVVPTPEGKEDFERVFGTQPALVLVRPDGYAAFTGSDQSLEELSHYLNTWFRPARENTHD